MSLNERQLALLHVGKSKLGLSDDEYRALLNEKAGVSSAKDLSLQGFEKVLGRFKELGFVSDRRRRTFGRRPGMATPAQIDYIRHLWSIYARKDGDRDLDHWLQNSFGISALRFADRRIAQKAIEALKAMSERKRLKSSQGEQCESRSWPGRQSPGLNKTGLHPL